MSVVRLVITSDLHGHLPVADLMPDGDVLAICGDICPVRHSHDPHDQSAWLDGTFRGWLDTQTRRYGAVVGIAGNHDFVFERKLQPLDLSWTYLEDRGATVKGLRFWGSPWQPPFDDWAFNLEESGIEDKLAAAPEGAVDVLLTHGPPYLTLDQTRRGEHVGSIAVANASQRLRPLVHAFGHIHEGYGIVGDDTIAVVNASLCDARYRALQDPWVIDVDPDARAVTLVSGGHNTSWM